VNPIDVAGVTVQFYTAEDILIRKLIWFRSGNEVSERQWRDILGILKVSGPKLDRDYLAAAATEVNITDLLERASNEAG
jgi:hypothetical protein